jgi:hypothetical protein
MNRRLTPLALAAAITLGTATAEAHISVASGPGFANTTQEITFGVGHGCSGTDTASVRIEIPAGVTSVRAETSGFGKATVETDAAGTVIAVTWQKPEQDVLATDTNYYKLTLRLKVPNQPFTTIYFPAHQTCRGGDAGAATVDWVGTPPFPDAGGPEPAPALFILPARLPGWNKFTVAQPVSDLAPVFGDAQIVWLGTAAFSANPATAELIAATAGVTKLTALAANDVIWVKY